MLSTLTIVSFFFAFAWTQQYFLNRIIKDDLIYLKGHQPPSTSRISLDKLHSDVQPQDS